MSETIRHGVEIDFKEPAQAEAYRQGMSAPFMSDKVWRLEHNPYPLGTATHEAWKQGFEYSIEELSE